MSAVDRYFEKIAKGGAPLMASAREGNLCLETDLDLDSPYVQREGAFLYLKRNWVYEQRIGTHLKRLSQGCPPIEYQSSELNEEQQKAVACALSHPLSIITGGPGTGKTFIARHLVQAHRSKKVILTAPTGKAAARLQELNPDVTCGTLHSILGIHNERELCREGSYVSASLIIVDECSMIDVRLFAYFLASVHHNTRVVLMGDGDQLPPIEAGTIFADLVDFIPTAHLTRCMRSDRADILTLAAAIKEGRQEVPFSPTFDLWKEIDGKDWNRFRILSCVREGPWGVNTLNQRIFARWQGAKTPILITRTDYDLDLYNGETLVLTKEGAFSPKDQRHIPLAALPPYEYAFSLSVHKSQGSEYDDILLLVPPGSEVFGREMLYTAVTRARHSIKICADKGALHQMLQKHSKKQSGIKHTYEVL